MKLIDLTFISFWWSMGSETEKNDQPPHTLTHSHASPSYFGRDLYQLSQLPKNHLQLLCANILGSGRLPEPVGEHISPRRMRSCFHKALEKWRAGEGGLSCLCGVMGCAVIRTEGESHSRQERVHRLGLVHRPVLLATLIPCLGSSTSWGPCHRRPYSKLALRRWMVICLRSSPHRV